MARKRRVMPTTPSALPRAALESLLTEADAAAAAGDDAKAEALLSDLHWYAHADGELHERMHRARMRLARGRGDTGGVVGQILPNVFARPISMLESRGPAHEVVHTVAAPPATVYRTIADVGAYAQWNPWVVKVEGTAAQPGDEVMADVILGGKRPMRVRHRVLVASPPYRFGWCDVGWFTVLASGRRLRWIEATAGGSRVTTRIQLWGPFAWLAWRMHGRAIRDGMATEGNALAARAAAQHAREAPAAHDRVEA
jgi:hypothetical protein